MKALRWHGPKDVRIDEVPDPAPAPGEVVIAVAACGICGSDLHEYLDGPVLIPKAPHPLTGGMPPVTLGHEFSGRVVEVGAEVEGARRGERVTVNPCLLCLECAWCRRGQLNYCAKLGSLGLSRDGALAPLVSVPAYGCHVLPPEVDDHGGAVVEPLAVALHACRRARLRGGERVAVIGAGAIGLLVLQVLKAKGAGWVAVIEPREERRRLARDLGADVVIDPETEDPVRAVARRTGEERVAAAFECVGSPPAFATAFRAAGKGGRVVIVGLLPQPVQTNLLGLLVHEKEIIGSSAYVDEFSEAIGLLAQGRIRIDPLVTAHIPLEDAPARGLEALLRREEAHVKILVIPTGPGERNGS
ncbi:MAG: 2,3-butanediol dehydrogenase [Nitrospinota bacterium]|jgi:(R,R)-butanediol dehydrogenase/meso-butanediol dehydrogenase/diacetyl reductase|nr:2,3-butanediol dehydrogenase [Nitrospinota bacterium]HJM42600.1 2,3-butanediol dehydrogenase [Nitrospinota bacterium]